MVILGLNAGFDYEGRLIDSGGSAILVNGVVAAAIAEERLTRQKYSGGFRTSMAHVLQISGLEHNDIDQVAVSFYHHPSNPGERSISRLQGILSECLSNKPPLFLVRSHHLSHAASAFYQCPFEEALVCVWDYEGSVIGKWNPDFARLSERHSYFYGKGNKVTLVERELFGPDDVGFGQAYSRFTRFVGLGRYTNAGKLMGLSAYGNPDRYASFGPLWRGDKFNRLTSVFRKRDGNLSIPLLFARQGMTPPMPGNGTDYERDELKDLAAFIQQQLEDAAIYRISRLIKKYNAPAVCIAGGVGLNSVLNARLQEALNIPVYVPPHPDDTGQAMGNVFLAHLSLIGQTNKALQRWHNSNALGGMYDSKEALLRLHNRLETSHSNAVLVDNIIDDAVKRLSSGAIIGWFQGRSEFGSRALGHRSILADPRCIKMKDKLNIIKGRELYRPIAPSVTKDSANKYFEIFESPLWYSMSGTARVKQSATHLIPSAIHIDGTSRIQIVDPQTDLLFHSLLTKFEEVTDIPILLNTSFNAAGYPIVESPEDAFDTARSMGIDALYLDNLRVEFRP